MKPGTDGEIERVMEDLRSAARARDQAIRRLKDLEVIRSRSLVGDLGEHFAKRHFGGELARVLEPGFDLRVGDTKVQVKTLRDAPNYRRSSMGVMKEPYDVLLAIRLDEDYQPVGAIWVPRAILEEHYPHGTRTSWSAKLENDPGVCSISGTELLRRRRGSKPPG